MARRQTVKDVIARNTGAGSRSTQYRKSARTSASVFAQAGMLGRNAKRRKSLGGKGG